MFLHRACNAETVNKAKQINSRTYNGVVAAKWSVTRLQNGK